jgi:DNA-binding MarR family transcriptional regulator
MKILVELTETQREQLEAFANQLGVSAEELAAAALQDLLAHDQSDFDDTVSRVLKKNSELYRRLA